MKTYKTCERCQKQFISFESRPNRKSRFCSLVCRFPKLPSLESRLLEMREIDIKTGCWLWTGAIIKGGYGQLRINRGANPVYVHHLMATRHLNYKKKVGLWVLHRCDVKRCFNPAHLYIGTIIDNTRDALQRGQIKRGYQSPFSKLSPEEVGKIRRSYSKGASQYVIAKKFDISQTTVSRCVNKVTY